MEYNGPRSLTSLAVVPTLTTQTVGQSVTLTATGAMPGDLVTFEVSSGPDARYFFEAVRADATGSATAKLTGHSAGVDDVVAWVDNDQNGIRNQGEPAGTTTVHWLWNYVAFGDSLTTGYSISACTGVDDRVASPWGCDVSSAPAVPYPDRRRGGPRPLLFGLDGAVSSKHADLPVLGLDRVGIWGYTAAAASTALLDGHDAQGPWTPQLEAIRAAGKLVTGAFRHR